MLRPPLLMPFRRTLALLALALPLAGSPALVTPVSAQPTVAPAVQPGAASSQASSTVLDEVVALVGSRVVLRSEVDAYAAQRTRGAEPSPAVWRDALRDLVDQAVLATVAERDTTIQVTPEQVNQSVDGRLRQISAQLGGDDAVERTYGRSLVRIREDLRTTFRDQLLAREVQQRRVRTVRVSPSDVQAWFDRIPSDSLPEIPGLVRVAHIARFPGPPQSVVEEARGIVASLRDSVTAQRGTFETYAEQFSEDPGSAANGGRITGVRLRELVPEFAAVAARQPLGEISQPFQSPFGYHILRVNDRRGDILDFSHILIRIDNSRADPAPAVAYLTTIRDSMATFSIPFEVMAKRHSEDPGSSPLGGRVVDPQSRERDLLLTALGDLWRSTVDTMQVGEVSKPAAFESLDGRRGVHIVLLQKKTDPHRVNLQDDYARIEQIALQEKQDRSLRTYLDQLRRQVFIEYRGKAQTLAAASPR